MKKWRWILTAVLMAAILGGCSIWASTSETIDYSIRRAALTKQEERMAKLYDPEGHDTVYEFHVQPETKLLRVTLWEWDGQWNSQEVSFPLEAPQGRLRLSYQPENIEVSMQSGTVTAAKSIPVAAGLSEALLTAPWHGEGGSIVPEYVFTLLMTAKAMDGSDADPARYSTQIIDADGSPDPMEEYREAHLLSVVFLENPR